MHRTNNLDDGYMGSSEVVKKAIKKYGNSNFKKDILYIFDNESDMINKEAELITEDVLNNSLCYNLKLGGIGKWGTSKSKRIENGIFMRDNKIGIFSQNNYEKTIHNLEWMMQNSLLNRERQLKAYDKCWGDPIKKSEILSKRKIKDFQKGENNSQFGTCWITNGSLNKKISLKELKSFEETGWWRGRQQGI